MADGVGQHPHISPSDVSFRHIERITWYATYLAKEGLIFLPLEFPLFLISPMNTDHKNFFFVSESPCIISVEVQPLKKDREENIHRVLVRSAKSDDRVLVSLSGASSGSRKVVAALKACHPLLAAEGNIVKAAGLDVVADLLELESRLLNPQFKFGVLYCKPGQKQEDEFYHNGWSSTLSLLPSLRLH